MSGNVTLDSCMMQIVCEDHGEDLVLLEFVGYDRVAVSADEAEEAIAGHRRHAIKFVSSHKQIKIDLSEIANRGSGQPIREVA